MALVAGIGLERLGTDPVASGGEMRVVRPWLIDEGKLEATQFEYRLGPAPA